jgi:hypothetical protein
VKKDIRARARIVQVGVVALVGFGTDILGTDRYLEQLKHSKVKGYLFQQQNYVPKE